MPLAFYIALILTLALIFIHLMWWGERRDSTNVTRHFITLAIMATGAALLLVFDDRLTDIPTEVAWILPPLPLVIVHMLWWADSRRAPGRNAVPHVVALAFNGVIVGAIVVVELFVHAQPAEAARPPLEDKQAIEASLAVKKTKVTQPQKKTRDPIPQVKPEGVSHDENKKVEPPKDKKDEPKKTDDKIDPKDLEKRFKHPQDDDDPAGKPVTNIGDFNGSEKGFATLNTGDKYFGELVADMGFNPPEISKDEGAPVGCIHLTPDGKIPETKFFESTSGDYQTAAEAALAQLKKARNDKPQPVPDNLLQVTTKWLCFKFTVALKSQ